MISCVITTSFLGCLVTLPLLFRYAYCPDMTTVKAAGLFVAALVLGCMPLLSDDSFENVFGGAYPAWRAAVWFIYIFCIILLTFTVARDAVWAVLYKTGVAVSPLDRGWTLRLNAATAAVALVASAWALYGGLKVPAVKTVEIVSDKIKTAQNVVLLSDLHIHRTVSPEKIKGIVSRANALNPDVVLLDGDILDDDVEKIRDLTGLLTGLKAKSGVYFVTGNHEFYVGYAKTTEALKQAGFTFLENSADSQFRLMMSHTPAFFDKADLTVSGHTHGGQIFPFHVLTKLANKYFAGKYDGVYVTRGAGQWGPQMRFLAPSEITLIKLTPAK